MRQRKSLTIGDITEGEREKALVELHHLIDLVSGYLRLAHASLSKPIDSLENIPDNTPLVFDGFVGVADGGQKPAAIARAQAAASRAYGHRRSLRQLIISVSSLA